MKTERQAEFKKLLELLKKQITNLQETLTAPVEEKRTIHKRVIEVERKGA